MDWYGVGDGHVLGMIDLDSLHLEAGYSTDRTAKSTRRLVNNHILYRHGPMDSLRSDHAREFMGKVMQALKAKHGYVHTSTGGYNATGNSTVERVWGYLKVCLLLLTDEEYDNVEDHLQEMVWAWNTTISESLTVSPFEVMTGTTPRTHAGCFLTHEPQTDLNISGIRVAAAEFTRVAAANADYTRKRNAEHLNTFGRKLRALEVGDMVKIFSPPNAAEAKRRKRKVKHLPSWIGPMRITAIKGSMYDLESHMDETHCYERNIVNIRPWTGPIPKRPKQKAKPTTTQAKKNARRKTKTTQQNSTVSTKTANVTKSVSFADPIEQEPEYQAPPFMIGEYCLYRDPDNNEIDLIRVTRVTDAKLTVRCYGTQGKNLKNARLTPVSVDKKGRVLLHKPRSTDKAKPFVWTIALDAVSDEIVARDVKLRKNGSFTADSLKMLEKQKPGVFHRF